jgi:SAM-dependent methyltransferase
MMAEPASYDAVTLEASEDFVRYNQWVVSAFGTAIGGRALEIGPGIGTLSALVVDRCTELVLVEPAPNLRARLTERFASHPEVLVCDGLLEEAVQRRPHVFAGGFDTVMAFNVLEHITDDVGALRLAADLLRPGGRLCLFVPALPWLYGSVDAQVAHVRRYTKATMRSALEAAGLRPERLQYLDFLGMAPWFVFGRILKRSTEGGGVGWYDRFVIPVCRRFDQLSGPPVGKSLVVVAASSR